MSANAPSRSNSGRAGSHPSARWRQMSTCLPRAHSAALLDDESVPLLRCQVVAGAANNQLASESVADLLAARGILWAPDFVVNAGGLINVAQEVDGYDASVARRRVRAIAQTLSQIFDAAQASGATPLTAAMELARRRLAGRD